MAPQDDTAAIKKTRSYRDARETNVFSVFLFLDGITALNEIKTQMKDMSVLCHCMHVMSVTSIAQRQGDQKQVVDFYEILSPEKRWMSQYE